MRKDVAQDMDVSSNDFLRAVVPALQKHCPDFKKGEFHLLEDAASTQGIGFFCDVLSGIDALHVKGDYVRGIASRVQTYGNFKTFTVRAARPTGTPTEYEKRLHAIQYGYLYPYWTIQAYTDGKGGDLVSFGVCKTKELYKYIRECESSDSPLLRRPAGNGGEEFMFVTWSEYKRAGNYLVMYDATDLKSRLQKSKVSAAKSSVSAIGAWADRSQQGLFGGDEKDA